MPTSLAEIREKVRELSRNDKATLIRMLIAEIDGPLEPDVERAWIAEAKKRHQELLDGRAKGIPAERVLARVRAILAR